MAPVHVESASRHSIGSLVSRQMIKRRVLPYLIFAASAGLYLLPFMKLLLQGTDEGTLAVTARFSSASEARCSPRDFFEVMGPGNLLLACTVFIKLFGAAVLCATRICLFVTSLATALATILPLACRACKRYAAVPVRASRRHLFRYAVA